MHLPHPKLSKYFSKEKLEIKLGTEDTKWYFSKNNIETVSQFLNE